MKDRTLGTIYGMLQKEAPLHGQNGIPKNTKIRDKDFFNAMFCGENIPSRKIDWRINQIDKGRVFKRAVCCEISNIDQAAKPKDTDSDLESSLREHYAQPYQGNLLRNPNKTIFINTNSVFNINTFLDEQVP